MTYTESFQYIEDLQKAHARAQQFIAGFEDLRKIQKQAEEIVAGFENLKKNIATSLLDIDKLYNI